MPHMKKILFGLMAVAAILTACNMKDKADYTPAIVVSDYFYIISDTADYAVDSLRFGYDVKAECYRTDTAKVNDTIQFALGLLGYGNNLTSFTMTWNPELIRVLDMPQTYQSAAFNSVALEEGSFEIVFKPGFLMIGLPVTYTTLSAGAGAVEMTLNSESEFSPVHSKFFAPCQ